MEELEQMNTGFTAPDSSSSTTTSSSSIWILDSAAAYHVVGDMSLFSPSSFLAATPSSASAPPPTTTSSTTANDHAHDNGSRSSSARALTIAGVGTVSCENFQLAGVLYDPDMGAAGPNRVSVQQLAQRGYLVVFTGGGGQCCSVVEQSSGKVVGEGVLHADDGLYHLQFLKIPPVNLEDAMDSWTAAP